MEYEELSQLWRKQTELYRDWERKLISSSHALKNELEEKLNLKSISWKNPETGRTNSYVNVVNFYPDQESIGKRLDADSITSKGELIFGLSLTFDHGADTYPKQNIYIPVAARFLNQDIQYTRFDLEHESPLQEWTSNTSEFCEKVIALYKEHLSHDPHTGFETKITMGFVGSL